MLQTADRILVFFAAGLVAFSSMAQAPAKPNLSGTWLMNPSKSELEARKDATLTWVIDQTEKEIHITQNETLSDGKAKNVEFRCTTTGKDCDMSGAGSDSKIALWYQGPMLVAMEKMRNGEQINKDQMSLSPDGKELSVEVSGIIPASEKPEKLVFEKKK